MSKPSKWVARVVGVVALALAGIGAVFFLRTPQDSARPVAEDQVAGEPSRQPEQPAGLDAAPSEVREFLDRVLARIPDGGSGVASYEFHNWEQDGKPTREGVGIKPVPSVDPEALIARVMDVDNYVGRIAHVEECRSVEDPAFAPPQQVRLYQRIRVPGVSRIQQEMVLVDAATVDGYRVAYWYLLKPETAALDASRGARSAFNVGAWFAAPGVVGYALSSWPMREDVNALQWVSLTRGADRLARSVVEGNIDGMAAWAKGEGTATATTTDRRDAEQPSP